ncbi:MAG: hypothetical protein WDA16_12545 [Candidatus Thermoplasmatota archaeon]
MRVLPLTVLVVLTLAGCTGGPTGNGATKPTTDAAAVVDAPWWEVGEAWTLSFETETRAQRTTTLVNFANNTFGDPPHFWLGVSDRSEALDHVFFNTNPFLGRIHWGILAPHEQGMHSVLYAFPLRDGASWNTGLIFGQKDVSVDARAEAGGAFEISGSDGDDVRASYDYEPTVRWFKHIEITKAGSTILRATNIDHKENTHGTFYFLRGRDYIDSKGGTTGSEQPFKVKDEGATSIAFLMNIQTQGTSAIEFIDPSGTVWHRETLPLGGAADKVVEVPKAPPAGDWKLRFIGSVAGDIKVRGIIEYKATI